MKPDGKLAEENKWYGSLHSSDRYWIFMVYNNGRGELVATSARAALIPTKGTVVSTARVPADLEQSYPLVCRGGSSLEIVILDKTNIGFKFVPGTKPAGEGLAPGECSWIDRGMKSGEPPRLSQPVKDIDRLIAGGDLDPENKWYEELHSPDKYWTFMVFNRHRQLNVTSARPKE